MGFRNIPFGNVKAFNVILEIPKGSGNKYEYDEQLDALKLDWVFTDGFVFPFDYGYIPETRGGDGDHLDAFVLSSQTIAIGSIAECRAIGIIEMIDKGEQDDKILAIPLADPILQNVVILADFDKQAELIFRKFFYGLAKQKNKIIEIKGFYDSIRAEEVLSRAHDKFTH